MKLASAPRKNRRSGMTLLELTVVILVLLSFVSILFIGARAWKCGSDRACCILNIRSAQQAIRGYANAHAIAPGEPIPGGLTRESVIAGPGSYLPSWPVCPGGGVYGGQELTTVPPVGVTVMTCTYSNGTEHLPDHVGDW
jgi:type II secretory pathway pseudopilin PulG